MSASQYLRRGGLTIESSSTFNALGLTSSSKSTPLIKAAHALKKKNTTSHNAAAYEPKMQAHPNCQWRALSEDTAHVGHRSPSLQKDPPNQSLCNLVELDTVFEVQEVSTISTKQQDPVPYVHQEAAVCRPFPSVLKIALAQYGFPNKDSDIAQTIPLCVMFSQSKTPSKVKYGGPKIATSGPDRLAELYDLQQMKLSLGKQATASVKRQLGFGWKNSVAQPSLTLEL